MPVCNVCGSKEFSPQDGYFYCNICQTQSQDVQEMELDYRAFTTSQVVKKKDEKAKKVKKKSTVNKLGDGPPWTSWQAFNFILRGMTDELIAIGIPEEVELHVLQLWAAYLSSHHIAFFSRQHDCPPKLGFPCRLRDAKVIYDLDTQSMRSQKSHSRERSKGRRSSASSQSSKSSTTSKRVLKRKLHHSLYGTHLDTTEDEGNMTLETLSGGTPAEPVVRRRKVISKKFMTNEAFSRQKKKKASQTDIVSKPQLLAILYIALRKMNQNIEMSDLFRFIHEGSLSYAKVSHMLPPEVRFGSTDSHYINYNKQWDMPTHWTINHTVTDLAARLKFKSLPVPDMPQLIRRYTQELLLPDDFAELAVSLLALTKPPRLVRVSNRKQLPAFGLIAVSAILVLFKLLLGMDGITERRISHFADAVNRLDSAARLFSFTAWQRAIESRNALLSTYHFPTHSLIAPDEYFNPQYAADHILSSSLKDPYLRERQRAMHLVKNEAKLVEESERAVLRLIETSSSRRKCVPGPNFTPSLTPSLTHLQALTRWLTFTEQPVPPCIDLLNQSWSTYKVTHLTAPAQYVDMLSAGGVCVRNYPAEWPKEHMQRAQWIRDIMTQLPTSELKKKYTVVVGKAEKIRKCPSYRRPGPSTKAELSAVYCRTDCQYWMLQPPYHDRPYFLFPRRKARGSESSGSCASERNAGKPNPKKYSFNLPFPYKRWSQEEFEGEIVPQFASTWLWLITQCSHMMLASRKDVYSHVLHMEHRLRNVLKLP